MASIPFDNTYVSLPERFYSRQQPQPVAAPSLIRVNDGLARHLGIAPEWLASAQGVELIAGNQLVPGADPIAAAYAGHQFGHFNPQLGDGRALLLGEVVAKDGTRYDLQLKGSGRTPYSRGGDGRSPLGPVLREFVVSEGMHALGIPTSRALAAVASGEPVARGHAIPGGVLLRVARSHIRVGTFEFFAARKDEAALKELVDYTLRRHYPERQGKPQPALELLRGAAQRQAALVARWQLVGFIHGVMNTDNMLVSGETIDYGPCAFMDRYDPATVYSSIDHQGRYAYRNQPMIARWNIACLARALLPLLNQGTDAANSNPDAAIAGAQQVVDDFPTLYAEAYYAGLGRKLGLSTMEQGDADLADTLLTLFQQEGTDFTLGFRQLASHVKATGTEDPEQALASLAPLPLEPLQPWLASWRARLALDPRTADQQAADMRRHNPVFIPRNHQVEAAIRAAEDKRDLHLFQELVEVITNPYVFAPEHLEYARPPREDERVEQTFCGT